MGLNLQIPPRCRAEVLRSISSTLCVSLRLAAFALAANAPLMHAASPAAVPTTEQLDFFESKIRPVLVDRCYQCHSASAEKLKGGLLLDSREGLSKGGDDGPIVIPGDPNRSRLIIALRYTSDDLKMPPKQPLRPEQVASFEAWIKMGAP